MNLRSFDHSHLAHLPEYRAVSRALDDLAHALKREEITISDQDWRQLPAQVAATLPFADHCSSCQSPTRLFFPVSGTVNESRLDACFQCDEGHSWTTRYRLDG